MCPIDFTGRIRSTDAKNLPFSNGRGGLMFEDKNTGNSVLRRMEVRGRYHIDLHLFSTPSFD